MSRRLVFLASLSLMFAAALLRTAGAQNILEKLVMPGELIAGHAKLEKDCSNCHVSFAKKQQSELCLACHKEIASDIGSKTGFHGRRADVGAKECNHCHQDHKGRGADIVGFDPQTFDHRQTDFSLQGAHATAPCQSCHEAGKPHRKAPTACTGCHKKDEPHEGRLGERCEGCHDVVRWLQTKPFDHGKTNFPLVGKHRDVACTTCHAAQQWKGLGNTCAQCHGIEDAHAGRYGSKCETCHASERWKPATFDHDTSTKFALQGEHRKVSCDSCHTGNLYTDKLAASCSSCHNKDDAHKGQLGARCETCHNATGWRKKVAFDHDLSKFPLIGLHAAVPCEACHKSASFKGAPLACGSCHNDTHHQGRVGAACETCHNPNGWPLWRFDHAKQTRFALTGRHAAAGCHDCHREKLAESAPLSTDCYTCHSADDAHRGSFGRACGTCHTTQSFTSEFRRR